MNDFFRPVTLCGALLGLLGCAGDDSSASYDVVVASGITADKTLVTLTDQEALALCDATADAASEIYSQELAIDLACTLTGATLSITLRPDGMFQLDRAECERTRDECVRSGEWSKGSETRTCELHPMRTTTGAACTASVAEYERCATAALHAGAALFESWTCAYLAAQPLTTLPTMPARSQHIEVPECAAFESKCGNLPPL